MSLKLIPVQKILLVLFVLVISFGVGWYGQKAIKKFMANSEVEETNKTQNL